MPVSLVPPIGSAGTWGLRAPFADDIVAGQIYSCVAVRRLSEFRLLGIDPFTQYYKPQNIQDAVYATDLAQGDVCIVSLQSTSGKLVFVPSTYINSYPNPNGYKYTPVSLVVDIGSIHNDLNLSAMKTDMIDLIKGYLGILSVSIISVKVGEERMITQSDHNSLEAARLGRVTATQTLHNRVQQQLAQITALTARNQELENYVLSLPPSPP